MQTTRLGWAAFLLAALLSSATRLVAQGTAQATPEAAASFASPAFISHVTRSQRFLSGRALLSGSSSVAASLAQARAQHLNLLAQPRTASLSAAWASIGPAQVSTNLFGKVTGRVTALAIDPTDSSGNTLYVGTTGGGVWKSTNAAGPADAVSFAPLTDTLPVFSANAGSGVIASLSIGSLAIANGVLLAGTGDPNDATDSYYGEGVLRSTDGGTTWTLIQRSLDGVAGNHRFTGLSFAGFSFSTLNPQLVVAAVTEAVEGTLVNAADSTNSVKGLYYSTDAGQTWHMATILDGAQVVQAPQPTGGNNGGNAATAVVWNPIRQRFYAAVRFHGYYESADGLLWTRLSNQPGAGLGSTACPANQGSTGNPACPIFRGALAVQAATGDTFALTVDAANKDQGLWQDACALRSGACTGASLQFGTALPAGPLESTSRILQGDYNLALAAMPDGADTTLYVGTVDLYRCSLANGCSLRNTTNAQNGCLNPAGVAPAQHAIAALGQIVYTGNDGGLYRSADAIAQTGPACSLSDASHFNNLNGGFGSLAEVVSFAQHPSEPGILLAGLGALGTAGTGSATALSAWPQLASGEGGSVAIDPATPANWYLSLGAGVQVARCSKGSGCAAADFALVVGPTQTAGDLSAIHAPWLLDPSLSSSLLVGTCRAWRGPAIGGSSWSAANLLSRPFGASAATGCSSTFPVVRSLAAGGPVNSSSATQNAGSQVLYAGLAGALDGGQGFGGHLFATTAAQTVGSTTVWSDVAKSPVANDTANAGIFNPGGFDISSVTTDSHDATGNTVYATVMGFSGNGTSAPHLYRSLDAGAHWANISSNLPNAPANALVVDPNDANTLYVALDTGVYVTTTVSDCVAGNCWSVYGSSLPNAPVVSLSAAAALPTGDGRQGVLRAATYGRGIWSIPLLTATLPSAPAIALNPTSLIFPAQQVATIGAPLAVMVTNTGTADLVVSSITTTGDFSSSDTCIGTPVVQGSNCTVQVSFAPTASGNRTGQLTVYGNVAGGQATASLAGTASTAANVVLTPVGVSYPATTVGATSVTQYITISNTGGTVAQLQSITVAGDFVLLQNTCGSALASQTGCTVGVAFRPTVAGARTGTLTVTDDQGVQVASLSGSGTLPATDALSPGALSFSAQALNTASPTQQITLTNAGDQALTLIAASIAGGDFTVVNGCGNSLNGHTSCVLSVGFVPRSLGTLSGTLTVADQFRSQAVALNGIGVAPPGVSLSPTTGLSFGGVGVGTSATTQTVTLTNNGGLPLALTSVVVNGDFYAVLGRNTCGTTVAPFAVCTVEVGFAPTATGTRNGTITFVDSAAGSPHSLALGGIGEDFTFAANGIASQTIRSGQSATFPLILRSDPGTTGPVAFTCSGQPLHTSCTVNPSTASLGGITLVSVTLTTGSTSATLSPLSLPWLPRQALWAVLLPVALLGRRRRFVRLLTLLALPLGLLLSGCGAARIVPGDGTTTTTSAPVVTPSGTSTILIAGSSAGLVRSVSLTLTVQ